MSSPARLVIADPSLLPEALRAPVSGVSFADYLVVEASRLDGLPLPPVLALLGLSPLAFERAEDHFGERLDDELSRDGSTFPDLYQDLLARALALFTRSIDPLDRDIEAFMTYQRHALDAGDPGQFARDLGLTPGDEIRLARRWNERLADPSIAERAQRALLAPLAPLPALTLAPLVVPETP